MQSPVEAPPPDGAVAVFLAGGSADPWRAEFARLLVAARRYRLFDPINFAWHRDDVRRRVDWEVRHLARADRVVAWFPGTTSAEVTRHSPTTLFEVGRMVGTGRPLHVGVAPDYPRRAELAAIFGPLATVDNLAALAAAIDAPPPVRAAPPAVASDFWFPADAVRFSDLFALGVAVEQGGPLTVAVAPASPLRRELAAQLGVLRPSLRVADQP